MLGLLSSNEGGGAARVEQPIELTAETLWTEVAGRLKGALNDSTYRTWFGEVEGWEVTDDTFVLAVPNDFTREWIEGHFLELIRAAVRDATGHQRRIQLTVTETGATPDAQGPPVQRIGESGLNTKYTFDLFVIGSSNRFAHAAALAVAEAPAQAYNPLFIYGGTGLGKTHLLQGIAQ
jgi:chromosomal replication initiator protein